MTTIEPFVSLLTAKGGLAMDWLSFGLGGLFGAAVAVVALIVAVMWVDAE